MNLETVTLSESLKRIGTGAFYGCSSLKTVNYPGSKETWDDKEKINISATWAKKTGKYTIVYDYKAEN